MRQWIWEAQKGMVGHKDVLGKHRPTMAQEESRFIFSLHLYCWHIYQLTNSDKGEQIGREWDTDPFSLSAANIRGVAFGGYDKTARAGRFGRITGRRASTCTPRRAATFSRWTNGIRR